MYFFQCGPIKGNVYVKKTMNMNKVWEYTEEVTNNLNEDELCKKVMESVEEDFNGV
jgi:hypothetical protein